MIHLSVINTLEMCDFITRGVYNGPKYPPTCWIAAIPVADVSRNILTSSSVIFGVYASYCFFQPFFFVFLMSSLPYFGSDRIYISPPASAVVIGRPRVELLASSRLFIALVSIFTTL